MFESLFVTISKGVNEYVFVIGIVGFVLLLLQKTRLSAGFHTCVVVAALMISWRIAYKIESSRYSFGLIYLFALVIAWQLSNTLRARNRFLKAFSIFLICGCLFFFGKKLYGMNQISQNISVVADTFRQYAASDKDYAFRVQDDDYSRLRHYSGIKDMDVTYSMDKQVLNEIIADYNRAYQDLIVAFRAGESEKDIIDPGIDKTKYRQILSLFSQKNKKKKYHCFLIRSNVSCRAISPSAFVPPENNLLVNGDVELADSPEASFAKLKKEIPGYESFYGVNEAIRTPENAYYYNKPAFMQDSPRYDDSDSDPIVGKRSVRIDMRNGEAFVRFYQKFSNGNYSYSMLVRGKTGTEVGMQYLVFRNNKGETHPLATFTLPDKRLYELSVSFSVDDLADNDYFRVAASVENGEAYLDQFSLTQAGQTDELQN